MKQSLFTALATILLLAGCNNNKKIRNKTDKAETQVKSTAIEIDSISKKLGTLKKLTPVGIDELIAMLPNELAGIKRTNFTASTAMGYAVAQGDYEKKNKTDIRMMVYDCAGEAGANLYETTYLNQLNIKQEKDGGYIKTIDFNGSKAIENYEKATKVTTLTYVANERILVVLTGRNVSPENLKEAAANM